MVLIFDFCDGRGMSSISCDKVCTDSNPVENLVSVQYHNKMAGFIGENFVRPPVNVTLQFPCNIEVFRVIINPVVGAQKSNGFEIYTCSNKVDTSHLLQNKIPVVSSKSSFFVPIGKMIVDKPGVICFTNGQFSCDESNSSVPPMHQYHYHGELKHGRSSALNFVSHLTVRITRTISGSAVCIKKLEVLGRPSKSCSDCVINKLKQLFSLRLRSSDVLDKIQNEKSDNVQQLNCDIFSCNNVDIPEDFIDSITQEIMTMPMVLPCGKNVDQSTLEKHVSAEASWGRMPSDPFTGMLFDSQKKATPNLPLKGRIDQFVLQNSNKLHNIPRTLGREAKEGPSTSRLVGTGNIQQSTNKTDTKQIEYQHKYVGKRKNVFDSVLDLTNDSDPFDKISLDNSKKSKREKIIDLTANDSETPTDCDEIIDLTSSETRKGSKTHASDLQSSLDSALLTTLGTLPSFTKPVKTKQVPVCCSLCKTVDSQINYKLSCCHYICRSCLTKSPNTVLCQICKIPTVKRDAVRAHIT
ncbi:U-box domain-containing protein 5 [Mytilus galloprovincialis]|uniref:U-box domain-containing protein 5 n=2 Tax=Mytilus galloprovincialis TaxID=29158 RepID=A0A8B6F9P8_MYTGA|nr:U-box domain-containing protein 5 [Mytilus galloprovincialis]